jgi:outer membrane protein TolC
LQNARSSVETNKAKQTAGTITALDVQSGEQTAKQAERDLENAVATTQVSGMKLQVALGKDPSEK